MREVNQNYNPAKRLYDILISLSRYNQGTNTKTAWQTILQTENEESFIEAFLGVRKLVNEIYSKSEELSEKEKRLYFRHFSDIDKFVRLELLTSSWPQSKQLISPINLESIEHLALFYEKFYNEKQIPKKDLDEWKLKLEEIEKEIVDSDIEPQVKTTFSKYIFILIQSISMYKITGANGLEEAIISNFGNYFNLYPKVIDKEPKGTKFKKAMKDFGSIIQVICFAIQTAGAFTQLAGIDVSKLLGN